jgi:ABC-type antimicrobial peptide transport system permease subunit
VDPTLPLFDVTTMTAALAEPLSGQRLGATLFLGFGGFGLLMAALGTYGVLAVTVGRRVPEFGVRVALGARPGQLLRAVLLEGRRLVAAGLALGTLVTLVLSPRLFSALSEVDPRDPLALAAPLVVLLAAGALASLLPALRATRVDPVRALNTD